MKITLAQLNPTVGDILGIRQRILKEVEKAAEEKSDVIIFPELATTGYAPRDLLYRTQFIIEQLRTVNEVRLLTAKLRWKLTVVLGCVIFNETEAEGRPIHNAAAVLCDGVERFHTKTLLPNYDVFDEVRYFEPGPFTTDNFFTFEVDGEKCGVVICEEMWSNIDRISQPLYHKDPVEILAKAGAKWVFSINASPFRVGVTDRRRKMVRQHCTDNNINMACVFQVGGNDEIVFDGSSFVTDKWGNIIEHITAFEERVVTLDTNGPLENMTTAMLALDHREEVRRAVILGLQDYARKQGITKLLVSQSGGIDSALAGYYAVQAVGAENCLFFTQPSKFSSDSTYQDAQKISENLGVKHGVIPIRKLHHEFQHAINLSISEMCREYGDDGMSAFLGKDPTRSIDERGVADENLQPRIRGAIMMAWANMVGGLLVTTGNKSEFAVGYCTLYGDMCGGYNPLKDMPKTMVFEQAHYVNTFHRTALIPWSIIERPPSAELKPNQKDTDSLPPYPLLDKVIEMYADNAMDVEDIIQELSDLKKYDPWLESWVGVETTSAAPNGVLKYREEVRAHIIKACRLIDGAEFKRRQAPLGTKVTERDLARGRQVPVVQAWTKHWMQQLKKE